MSSPIRIGLSLCLAALLSLGGATLSYASSEDDAKLKELERAMNAPAAGAAPVKKKYGTRAIVFDNEPQSGAVEPAKPAATADCGALPPDVSAVSVDFAIQFKLGSAEVAPESEGTLRQIAKILGLNPDRCILVEGHTDATGNADRNMALSRDRADSVVRFIVEKAGMDRSRLAPIGKGQNDPLKNLDPRNPKNRRVVFKVVG